jgi:RNA polymerase sigma factor (sigma-70 family)
MAVVRPPVRHRTEARRPGSGTNAAQTRAGTSSRSSSAAPSPGDTTRWYLQQISRYDLLDAEEERALARQIEEGRRAGRQLALYDAGSPSYRAVLAAEVERGRRARKRFVESNLRLVVSVAVNYASASYPLLDCIQEGNLGLMEAVERFDWRRGYRFSTYATWWIRQAITRALVDKARTIRLPARMTQKVHQVRRATDDLVSQLHRLPSPAEVAPVAGLEPEEVAEVLQIADSPVSIHHTIGTDSTELGEVIEDGDQADPGDAVGEILAGEALLEALDALTALERTVVTLRFGLDSGVARTLADVGTQLRMKPQRVRQVEAEAIAKLRASDLGTKIEVA